MKVFCVSYLASVVILAALGIVITARGVDAPMLLPMLGAIIVPFPATIVGIVQPNAKRKVLLGFAMALIGILLIIFLLPMLGRD